MPWCIKLRCSKIWRHTTSHYVPMENFTSQVTLKFSRGVQLKFPTNRTMRLKYVWGVPLHKGTEDIFFCISEDKNTPWKKEIKDFSRYYLTWRDCFDFIFRSSYFHTWDTEALIFRNYRWFYRCTCKDVYDLPVKAKYRTLGTFSTSSSKIKYWR